MKSWQLLLIGFIGLALVLLLPIYERVLAAAGACATIAAVAAGFFMHPRHEVYIIRSRNWVATTDDISLERDAIAVRLNVVRLWLLFLPTFVALGFLIVTATRGVLWNFSVVDRLNSFIDASGSFFVFAPRTIVFITWVIISTWVNERWTFSGTNTGCTADSVSIREGRVSYSFRDAAGEYYGGEGIAFGLVRDRVLATLVFYSSQKPERNKIAINCIFHQVTLLGRGLTELDEQTWAARVEALAMPSQN